METLKTVWMQIQGMRWTDYLDIIIVAYLFYKLLPLFRSTGTVRIAWVVGVIILVASLTDALELHALSYIFSQVLAVGLLALVVLFQPELRRMIDHLSNVKISHLFGTEKPQQEKAQKPAPKQPKAEKQPQKSKPPRPHPEEAGEEKSFQKLPQRRPRYHHRKSKPKAE